MPPGRAGFPGPRGNGAPFATRAGTLVDGLRAALGTIGLSLRTARPAFRTEARTAACAPSRSRFGCEPARGAGTAPGSPVRGSLRPGLPRAAGAAAARGRRGRAARGLLHRHGRPSRPSARDGRPGLLPHGYGQRRADGTPPPGQKRQQSGPCAERPLPLPPRPRIGPEGNERSGSGCSASTPGFALGSGRIDARVPAMDPRDAGRIEAGRGHGATAGAGRRIATPPSSPGSRCCAGTRRIGGFSRTTARRSGPRTPRPGSSVRRGRAPARLGGRVPTPLRPREEFREAGLRLRLARAGSPRPSSALRTAVPLGDRRLPPVDRRGCEPLRRGRDPKPAPPLSGPSFGHSGDRFVAQRPTARTGTLRARLRPTDRALAARPRPPPRAPPRPPTPVHGSRARALRVRHSSVIAHGARTSRCGRARSPSALDARPRRPCRTPSEGALLRPGTFPRRSGRAGLDRKSRA